MATGEGNAGNPFQSLLGDLINVLGSSGTPDQWEMPRSFAINVATGGTPEPNVEPVLRIQLEQLARVAELNVSEATGLPVAPDGRRLTCVAAGRTDWTALALESWRPILSAMSGPATSPPGAAGTNAAPEPAPMETAEWDSGTADPFAGLLGQWATAVGPLFFGLQVGSVV